MEKFDVDKWKNDRYAGHKEKREKVTEMAKAILKQISDTNHEQNRKQSSILRCQNFKKKATISM
jgi:hypothetical protein